MTYTNCASLKARRAFCSTSRMVTPRRLTSSRRRYTSCTMTGARPGDISSATRRRGEAIGRALMASPRLILADEMSQGLAPVIVQEVYRRGHQRAADGEHLLLAAGE